MHAFGLVSKWVLAASLCLASLVRPGGASADPTLTTLHIFSGTDGDGAFPAAGLIFDASGALYGTTQAGGANCASNSPAGFGTVFRLTPPATAGGAWTESVLHSFTGTDGFRPRADLIFDTSGALYGTTETGGTNPIYASAKYRY
jgi:uncharacterized repeat protein (TIGR03803 family)